MLIGIQFSKFMNKHIFNLNCYHTYTLIDISEKNLEYKLELNTVGTGNNLFSNEAIFCIASSY